MLIYLVQSRNLSYPDNGFGMALRTADHNITLISFIDTNGLTFPIHAKPEKEKPDADLLGTDSQSCK